MERFKTLSLALVQLFIGLLLFVLPITDTYAKAGCCSGSGGVVGCSASGVQMCKDGSTSPSCKCTPPATSDKKATGCCSGHGGVASCNKETGFQMCKGKTQSSSCKCSE